MKLSYVWVWALIACLAAPTFAKSTQLKVAVASNFVFALTELKGDFERLYDAELLLSSGSTGLLSTQIQRGAPFDVFFAADQANLAKLHQLQLVKQPRTYATGQLVLWQPTEARKSWSAWLAGAPKKLVIAEPKLAPYGAAAQQVIERNGIELKTTILANNINQAFHYVDSGNVRGGFLAESSLVLAFKRTKQPKYKNYILVPASHYGPIKQDVAVLSRSNQQQLSAQLIAFVTAPVQQAKLQRLGYQTVEANDG